MTSDPGPWLDAGQAARVRAAALLAEMTLAEKLAQLGSAWVTGAATGLTGLDMRRAVEPGVTEVQVGTSSTDLPLRAEVVVTGERTAVPRPDRYLTIVHEGRSGA